MAKIYTKKGDGGTTSLGNGRRVGKDDLRIELLGQLDELNATIGVVKALTTNDTPWDSIQDQLMALMGIISKESNELEEKDNAYFQEIIKKMENDIDKRSCQEKFGFVKPGKHIAEAFIHLARTKARTCERRMTALAKSSPVPSTIRIYMNRLSDYLFALTL
ncbi:MAG: cob(I)yrinic acid a,c-diamide adenosyltransferase [Prevotella sp.]|jgi:cob(I)alamin adenosyltransferase